MDAVIVTFNSARDLAAQLACEPLRDAFDRIYVVDNGSSDETVAIAQSFGTEVVERCGNDGFAAGVNAGAALTRGPMFAILNPDIQFDDNSAVQTLVRGFEVSDVALVAPALRLPDGTLQDSARAVPGPADLLVRRLLSSDRGVVTPARLDDVPWVVGACVIVRRTAFDQIGGFDESFTLYFEDVDFCVRLWSSGWRVRLDPGVVVRHEHAASSRQSLFGRAMRLHTRSAMRFFRKHPDMVFRAGRRRVMRPQTGPSAE